MDAIASAIADTRELLDDRPDPGSSPDRPVTAHLESGVRCTFPDESGGHLATDLPVALGGAGSAPSPGMYVRGAAAACIATVIAMRAAEVGVTIGSLSATVSTSSDVRSFLAMREGPVGFVDMTVTIDIEAPTATPTEIDELIGFAVAHAPVSQSLLLPVPIDVIVNAVSTETRPTDDHSTRELHGDPV